MEDIIDHFEEDEDVNLKDWQLFIGPKSTYYIPRWLEFKPGKSKASFNIAAFFFGAFWMLYRKMYIAAAIWFGLILFEGFFEVYVIEEIFGEVSGLDKILNWVVAAIMGFYGNYFYFKNAEQKIARIRNSNYSDELYEEELQKQGGTSWIPPLLGLLFFVLLGLLAFMMLDYEGEF